MRKQRITDVSIVDIDPNNLDKDWDNQPRLTLHYCRMLANAWQKLNDARVLSKVLSAKLKRVAAKMNIIIRKNPAKYGLKSVTESGVANAVLACAKYNQVQQECFDTDFTVVNLQHDVDMLEAAVKAIQDRKSALENRVRLHGQSYFSKPQANSADTEAMKESKRRRIRKRS